MDTYMDQQDLDQDMNLMPYYEEVDPLDSPYPKAKKVPSNQGDTDILGDKLEGEMHNISFNEL